MQRINHLIRNRRAKEFNFSDASSHQLLHELDVHLNDKLIDNVILLIGINDLSANSSRSGLDNLISNMKKITEKCFMFCAKNVFVSGLVYTTKVD